ncbi:hypothetical protein E2C01_064818 [Portunus trituberculatus]|uniref:Uncharacterized protein n=1 Tax=Portunus trituberculatus TaxID=210409 RepID=A0A5B7HKV3_PORTR|nr:hypothetical protein [Portunus trituberculatus]
MRTGKITSRQWLTGGEAEASKKQQQQVVSFLNCPAAPSHMSGRRGGDGVSREQCQEQRSFTGAHKRLMEPARRRFLLKVLYYWVPSSLSSWAT